MATRDELQDAREAFKCITEHDAENRQAWEDDVRFARLGEQWPEAVKMQRQRDGRPCLTINRLPAFAKQVTNDARQNRPAIKCLPVGDGADQETAEILNGLIRNIEYSSDAEVAYDTALEHAVYGGFGYFRINTKFAYTDSFDQDLCIERISNPLTVYGDEKSTAADSSDWNVAFVTDMLADADYEARFGKGLDKVDWQGDESFSLWHDEERTRIAEWWTREDVATKVLRLSNGAVMLEKHFLAQQELMLASGLAVIGERPTKIKKVRQRIINGAEVLEDNSWAGQYIPIIPCYGDEVLVDGKRRFISLIRFAKDAQQMFNFWRTASTELVALAPRTPFIGPKGAFNTDASKWASANTTSHAYIEYDGPVPPQRQAFSGPPAGALQEALNASDDMKSIMGLFDASLGARSNETSGRAIMARQREGDISTFNFIDNLSRAIRHAGRVLVDMIPHVYNTERIVRVIKEDGANKSVPINQQFNPQDYAEAQQDQAEDMAGMVKLYDLTVGKYDIRCEAGPSFTTKREEAAVQMTEFVRAFPPAAQLIGDLIAKNMDWPGADDIAKRLRAMLPPQLQGQNPQAAAAQQQMQQMDMMAKEAVATLQSQIGQLQQQLQAATTKEQAAALDKQIDLRKLEIDEINAKAKHATAQADLVVKEMQLQEMQRPPQDNSAQIAQLMQIMDQAVQALQRPMTATRDETGAIVIQ